MAGEIARKLLVKGLSLQQMGGGADRGFITFDLPPHGFHIVSPGEDYALPHIKTIFNTVVVQNNDFHIKVRVFFFPGGVGSYNQLGNHICGKVGTPYNGVRGCYVWGWGWKSGEE